MVGSAIEGEDVVQEALVKAAEAYPTAGTIERPEGWLFRIAHNAALDALRRRRRRIETGTGDNLDHVADPGAASDARVVAANGLAALLQLPVAQRSSLLLIDLLGHSATETSGILGIGVPAVKAALHRARIRMKDLADLPEDRPPPLAVAERDRLRAYADRFNARDFDALRDLLAEDVRLDLVNRTRLAGRRDVAAYFGRYGNSSDWWLAPGLAEGRPALLVGAPDDPTGAVAYIVLLTWMAGRMVTIRDFRYAPYVMDGLAVTRL
jgi:RNA polymerase sigma-70 factor (ECF subfamily)